MGSKLCAVCKEPVEKGSGIIYYGKLVHRKCRGQMKMFPWRFQ